MRMMDLPGWMPKPVRQLNSLRIGAIDPGRGKIQSVVRVKEDRVVFTCVFNNRPVYFELHVEDKTFVEKVAEILKKNRGKTLISISTIELPSDEEAA